MYIIVVGGGTVGQGLALELLDFPDDEVALIENDVARAQQLREELGEMVVHGDGTEIVVLDAAGAARADLLVAVTGDDTHNFVASQVAKHWFHVDRTIARVNDPRNERLFKLLGIDATVSAAAAVLAQLETSLSEHTVVPLMQLQGSDLQVANLHVIEGSAVADRAVRDLDLPQQTVFSLVIGLDGAPRLPSGETVLRTGDEVIAVIAEDSQDALRKLFAPAVDDADA